MGFLCISLNLGRFCLFWFLLILCAISKGEYERKKGKTTKLSNQIQWCIILQRVVSRAGPSVLLKHQISLWGEWFRGDTATKAAQQPLGSALNVLGHCDFVLQLQNKLFKTQVWGCHRAGGQPHTGHLLLCSGHSKVTEPEESAAELTGTC